MALIGDSCVRCGSSERRCGDPVSIQPRVVFTEDALRAMLRVRVELSAEGSYTEDPEDVLFFRWSLVDRPVDDTRTTPPAHDGGPVAAFTAESLGLFTISVTAVGANGGCSDPSTLVVAVFSSLSPLYEGTALDTSWVWQLLPDFWSQINKEARHKTELVWRGLTQLLGSDLTRAFDLDTSKSIDDVQDTRTIRWHVIHPTLDVPDAAWRLHPYRAATAVSAGERVAALSVPLTGSFSAEQRVSVRVINPTVISVFPSTMFTPSTFDRGAQIRLTILGREYAGRVGFVAVSAGAPTEYVITGTALPTDAVSADQLYSAVLTYPSPENLTLPVVVDGRGTVARSTGDTLTLLSSYINTGDSVSVYPAVVLRGAQREGVRAGDRVTVTLRDAASSRSADVTLEVAGVTANALMVKPVGDLTFTDILDVLAYTFARNEDARAEFKAQLARFAQTTARRVEGATVTRSSALVMDVFGVNVALSVTRMRVHRRHVIRASGELRALGVLREFTERYRVSTDGQIRLTDSMRAVDMGRRAIDIVEGSGFRVVRAPRVTAPVSGTRGYDRLTCPTENITLGDALVIGSGVGAGRYVVTDVYQSTVRVSPSPSVDFSSAEARIIREGVEGASTLIEFITPLPSPPPERLWCEGALFASDEVERRYGAIVGLTRAAWERRGANAEYIDAVRALYYARMQGQTPHAVARTVAVLLGLPYTPRRAVVRRIDRAGNSARVLLEDLNSNGEATGAFQVHDVVTGDDDSLAADTGLVDAANGAPIQVGSELEAMTVLSRGVSVLDSVDTAETDVALRHTFSVSVTASRVPLAREAVALFRMAIEASRPAYTRVTPRFRSAHSDTIEIETSMLARVRKLLADTPYALSGPAEIQDDEIPGIGRLDAAAFVTLTTWFPHDGVITSGVEAGTLRLTSASGGFSAPPPVVTRHGRTFNTRYNNLRWISAGDTVQLRGRQHPPLEVVSVASDTELILRGAPMTGEGLAFQVSRAVSELITRVTLTAPGSAYSAPLPHGVDARRVAPGDLAIFPDLSPVQYRVRRVVRGVDADRVDFETRGYPPLPTDAITGEREMVITRPSLSPRERVVAVASGGGLRVTAPAHALQPGDTLHTHEGDRGVIASRLEGGFYLDREISDFEVGDVRVTRPLCISATEGTDETEIGVRSSVTFVIRSGASVAPSAFNEDGTYNRLSLPKSRVPTKRAERGDVVRLVGDTLEGGEGAGVWRVIDIRNRRVILNRPPTPLVSGVKVEWARQAPLHPAEWRE